MAPPKATWSVADSGGVSMYFHRTQEMTASSTTTTVRVADGKSQVLNGPYVDTKEQLGGFYIIDVPDLQAAVAWAERCPTATHGTVEVRPLWADAA